MPHVRKNAPSPLTAGRPPCSSRESRLLKNVIRARTFFCYAQTSLLVNTNLWERSVHMPMVVSVSGCSRKYDGLDVLPMANYIYCWMTTMVLS